MGNLTLIPNLKSKIDFCLRILEKKDVLKKFSNASSALPIKVVPNFFYIIMFYRYQTILKFGYILVWTVF